MKKYEDKSGDVIKYVFSDETYVAETILYKYEDFLERTVICCSTQSGCPVGCKFCGTGNKFIRNLSTEEIIGQIIAVLNDNKLLKSIRKAKRFQIMFMSMGEPMLNWGNVQNSMLELKAWFPNAELLISTIGIKDTEVVSKMIGEGAVNDKFGLQFSIHKSNDESRNKLIPYENKMSLREIRDVGIVWNRGSGRPVYLNYCIDGTNNTEKDFNQLSALFSPLVFNFTFSVVCSANETMKEAGYKNIEAIELFQKKFIDNGYNTRVFNPEGQDDIGGGCGQLWYVQDWMKTHKKEKL